MADRTTLAELFEPHPRPDQSQLLTRLDRWLEAWGVPLRIQNHIRMIATRAGRERHQHVHMRPTLFVEVQAVNSPSPGTLSLAHVLRALERGERLPQPPR
jgi:hypothetical protein